MATKTDSTTPLTGIRDARLNTSDESTRRASMLAALNTTTTTEAKTMKNLSATERHRIGRDRSTYKRPTRPTITKATDAECAAYRLTRHCYPLHGWVMVSGTRCAVEFPNEGRDQPKYEVIAPRGFHFAGDVLHSMLATSIADLRGRLEGAELEACRPDRCNEDPAEYATTAAAPTTEAKTMTADDRKNPAHPRHRELMLPCCAQSTCDGTIKVKVEALDDTPDGVANGRTIYHVSGSDMAQNGIFAGCPLGRGATEIQALADFVRRANADDRALRLHEGQLHVTERADYRRAVDMDAAHAEALTMRPSSKQVSGFHAPCSGGGCSACNWSGLARNAQTKAQRTATAAAFAQMPPTIHVAVVFGDAHTVTAQYAGWDTARSEVKRMASEGGYGSDFAAVFMWTLGETITQWTNVEMDELRRIADGGTR